MGLSFGRSIFLLYLSTLSSCIPASRPRLIHHFDQTITIPAGYFIIGSDDGLASSRPAHLVSVSALEIDRFEVTNRQFSEHVELTGDCSKAWQGGIRSLSPSHPVAGFFGPSQIATVPGRASGCRRSRAFCITSSDLQRLKSRAAFRAGP